MVTILAAISKVSADRWIDFTKWLTVAFISGKTISHAVETMKPGQQQYAQEPLPTATAQPK